MSFRLFGLAAALLILCGLTTHAHQGDLEQLTQQLANGTKGKSSARFILNRGVGDGALNDATTKLAGELGFVDGEGKTDRVVLQVPMQGNADWLGTVTKLHQDGQAKAARAIEVGSPVTIVRDAVQRARAKYGKDHAAFQAYLRDQKARSDGLGLKTLDEVEVPDALAKGPLQYFAKRFFLDKAYEDLRLQAEAVHKLKPWLGIGGPYAGHFEENVDAQVLYAWRTKALTSPWVAERSWQNGDFSPQGLGYYLALARNAMSQNDILCDLHVGSGNYPDGVRRSFYLGIAQGARGIRFVGAVPPSLAGSSESLPVEQIQMWKTLRELGQEAAKFEHVVAAAKPRKADVGIVVSLTQELWDNSAWVHEERKALYQAARLGGHNVVILTDEDIQEGMPKLSSVYYIGHNIQRETAKRLRAWVIAGGSLGCVGGPFRDEYDQPIQEMLDFLGVEKYEWVPGAKAGPAKITLAQLKPTEEVEWGVQPKRFFPLVYGKLKFTPVKDDPKTPPDPVINARFKDGSIACVTMEHSPIAHAWLYAAPIGSGWLKTVLPRREWKVGSSPTSYNHRLLVRDLDGDAGDMVMGATGDARWDVITDNLAVETILMEGNKGIALFCINWSTMKPQQARLTAQYLPPGFDKATSLDQGPISAQRRGAVLDFKARVNVTDVVLIEPSAAKIEGR